MRARDESAADWILESVTFPAPYGGETVAARVYIPKRGTPPYQAVIFVTGAAQFVFRTPGEYELRSAAPLVRAGRLVIAPVLKGAYERHTSEFDADTSKSSTLWRDYVVAWHKDIARTIDYLQTRADIDRRADRVHGLQPRRCDGSHHTGAGTENQGGGARHAGLLPGAPSSRGGRLQLHAACEAARPHAERQVRLDLSRTVATAVLRLARHTGRSQAADRL